MIEEPFAVGNTYIYTLDPRVRIVFAVVFSFVTALSNRFPVLIAALFISILLVSIGRLKVREVLKRLFVVFWFLLLIWVILPLTFEGEPLYQAGPITFTRPGVIMAAQISIKSTAILLVFMALIATMTVVTLGHSLNRLYVPDKLVHLMLMTYRYIFVIEQEYRRLFTAIKIRGFCSKTNMHSYKTYAYLIGMLFVRASTRAERVHQAMLCRGFRGRFYTLDSFKSTGRNQAFVLVMTIIIVCLIIGEYNLL